MTRPCASKSLAATRGHHPAFYAGDLPRDRAALLGVLLVWSLVWKGFSLWRAARDDSRPWFASLLVTNTAGLLDAVYLFWVSPRRDKPSDELHV